MPDDLPPWQVVYEQTQCWIAAGMFESVVHDLRAILRLTTFCEMSLHQRLLLPVPHSLVPLPKELCALPRTKQNTLYDILYSVRSATIGSTDAARRAGT